MIKQCYRINACKQLVRRRIDTPRQIAVNLNSTINLGFVAERQQLCDSTNNRYVALTYALDSAIRSTPYSCPDTL
jgi:hypothetical protein